jgi:hypothetical protein
VKPSATIKEAGEPGSRANVPLLMTNSCDQEIVDDQI